MVRASVIPTSETQVIVINKKQVTVRSRERRLIPCGRGNKMVMATNPQVPLPGDRHEV